MGTYLSCQQPSQKPLPSPAIFRWHLDDFVNRFERAAFKQEWTSNHFEIKEVPRAVFYLRFYPKGAYKKDKNACGLFLCVRHFGPHPLIRLKFDLWLKSGERELAKMSEPGYDFVPQEPGRGWGWAEMIDQKKLLQAARKGPVVVCCKVVPLNPVERADEIAETNVLQKLAVNFNSDEFADIEVHVQGRVFKVVKFILCSGSSVFHRMFTNDTKEKRTGVVEIKDEDADVIELLLRYLYSGRVNGLAAVAHRLLPVADYYEVLHLAEMCLEAMYDQVSIGTVLRDLKLASFHDHKGDFKRKLVEFARENLEAVKQQPEWTPDFVRENEEIMTHVLAPFPF